MPFASVIKLGSLTLGGVSGANNVANASSTKVQATAKSRINGRWTMQPIPGKGQESRITIRGKLKGTNKDADRTTLSNYDGSSQRRYEDGIISTDVIIEPDSLVFDDDSNNRNEYPYTMVLRQF